MLTNGRLLGALEAAAQLGAQQPEQQLGVRRRKLVLQRVIGRRVGLGSARRLQHRGSRERWRAVDALFCSPHHGLTARRYHKRERGARDTLSLAQSPRAQQQRQQA
jgi:hypothetical protein